MKINSIQFSPDDKLLLSTSLDGTARFWDTRTGAELLSLEDSGSVINAIYSPDSHKLALLSFTGVSVWDANTKELLFRLKEHFNVIYDATFNGVGDKLITASGDSIARIWDINNGRLIHELKGHTSEVNCAAFSPDDERVVTGSSDGTCKLWNSYTGELVATMKGHTSAVYKAFFSPAGGRIISIGFDSLVKSWNGYTGEYIGEIKGMDPRFKRDVNIVSYNNEGDILLLAGYLLRIVNLKTKEVIDNMNDNSLIDGAIFSPDGTKILTSGLDSICRVRNAKDGKLLVRTSLQPGRIENMAFSNDGKKIAFVCNGEIRILETRSGILLKAIRNHNDAVKDIVISTDGKTIATASIDRSIKIWDTNTWELKGNLVGHTGSVNTLLFISPGKNLLSTSDDSTIRKWNLEIKNQVKVSEKLAGRIETASCSPDLKEIAVGAGNDLYLMNTHLDIRLHIKAHTQAIETALFSPDGKIILTSSIDSTAKIWDAVSGKLLYKLDKQDGFLFRACFSPDGKNVLFEKQIFNSQKLEASQEIYSWDYESGKIQFLISGGDPQYDRSGRLFFWKDFYGDNPVMENHASNKKTVFKEPDGKNFYALKTNIDSHADFLYCASGDHVQRCWDLKTGKLVFRFFSIDSTDYFIQLLSGYYKASVSAAKLLHYVTKDLKVITFEQLDVKYNRPDKVLEAIGNTDTALINSYRKAWEKRIKKLGIDTTAFRDGYSVPECDFVNRDNIEFEQKNGTLSLRIKGVDSTYKLDRFNVWVNEAPLFGQRGISIRRRNKNVIDTTITIKLSQGENRIEASITNVNGTESYRMPLIVNYTPAVKEKETLHFIGIGMDKFADPKYNLQYSSKDIRDLSVKLKQKYGAGITIDTLFNENVSVSSVKALKQKLFQSSVNDKVIVAYSGHGMLSKDYDYYLSTFSVNFDKPEENGLPYDELENLLDSIPARKKLMLIDACHSGEVDKDDLVTLNASSDSLIKGLKPVAYKKEGHLGLKNSFELMQSLFVNVGKSTGATIISAAAGTQFALERNDLKNGVFTYSILEAMNKYPTLKISELKKIVGERVEELTKGLQKPTSRNENIAVDWELW
ncbi:MAG TPA: caspase family protein [Chitinophagaceae bacterium]|nr:caspase family protein [Chitinophagaceae bacterium]